MRSLSIFIPTTAASTSPHVAAAREAFVNASVHPITQYQTTRADRVYGVRLRPQNPDTIPSETIAGLFKSLERLELPKTASIRAE